MTQLQLYLLIAVAALISWESIRWNEGREETVKIAENSPDFFSSGYYKKQMDINGMPKNELLAVKMLHYKDDGSTFFEKPFMTLFNQNGQAPWLIKAESGVLAADGDNLQLAGATTINRDASKNAAALTINTSDLHVKLSTNFAETTAWAEIISPPHKTSGTGMEAIFQSPIHLKLLSMVKGYYELK
ncbi:MAG: LPS export ABC transporter periplasmic protein LptC [Methylomonas sp.]|jgi:lipopolysaccharide export system protein LptC